MYAVHMLRLVGTHQIRAMLGASRSYTAQVVNRKGFPDPVGKLGKAQIWLEEDVEAWARVAGRQLHPTEENQ